MTTNSYILSICVVTLAIATICAQEVITCPTRCQCSNESVIVCSRADYSVIPTVPVGTVELYLDDNQLGGIVSGNVNHLRNLTLLDLSGNDLTILDPPMLDDMESLKVLRLSRNRLTYIPDDLFKRARNIEEIDLSSNELFEMPYTCLKHVTKLKKLILSRNKIQDATLRIRLQTLRNIAVLDLSHNPLGPITSDTFDVVKQWSQSVKTGIDLSFCDLDEVRPGAFGKLKGVYEINLAGNPLLMTSNLTDLNERLSEFRRSSLKVLNVSYMEITSLASVFDKFRQLNLKELDISNNGISNISNGDINNLKMLTYLNLANNNITSLSHGMTKLIFLKYLDISGNNIDELPENFTRKVVRLRTLNAANNEITEISQNQIKYLAQLKYLNLNNNGVAKLDAEKWLPKIEKLHLRGNQLSETNGIPKHKYLKEIDLSRNRFVTLGSFIFRYCENISFVNLSHNRIEEIDHQVFTPRVPEIIDLSYNHIKSVKYFGWLSAREIYFRGNEIEEVDFQAFLSMNKLEILDLSKNKLEKFKYNTFQYLTHIRELYLQENRLQLHSEDSGIFHSMAKLTKLDLANNKIHHIRGELIAHHPFLEYLSFRNNLIQVINASVFDPLSNLKILDLSGNPFRCGCDLVNLQNWLRNKTSDFPDSQNYTCYLPLSRRGEFLTYFELDTFECGSDMIYIVVASTLICVAIVVWVILTISCHFYWKRKRSVNLEKRIKENFQRQLDALEASKSVNEATDDRVFQEVHMNGKLPNQEIHPRGNRRENCIKLGAIDKIVDNKNLQGNYGNYNGYLRGNRCTENFPSSRRYRDDMTLVSGDIATLPRNYLKRGYDSHVMSANQIAELYGTLSHRQASVRIPYGTIPMYYKRGMTQRNASAPLVLNRRDRIRRSSSMQWV